MTKKKKNKTNLADRIVNYVAPIHGLKRTIARQRAKRLADIYEKDPKRSFDAVGGGRMHYDFLNEHNDADTAIHDSAENLRNHIRQVEYNNGYLKGAFRRLADHITGTGFRFQARVMPDKKYLRISPGARITSQDAETFNYHAEKYFNLLSSLKHLDLHMKSTFGELTWLVDLARHRDGEVLIIGRNSKRPDRIIPYCQQIVEIDRLETPPHLYSDPNVYNGIRYDSEGVDVAYYIKNRHPGDSIHVYKRDDNDYEEVPAFNKNGTRKVIHLYRMLRPEQSRGFAEISAALTNIQQATRYSEAEMFAALEDACMTGIVTTPAAANFQSNYTESGDDSDKRIHEFSPNKWHYMNPGQEVTIRDPSRPNDKFLEILHSFYTGPANAINMPPEVFLQNWQGMNYSNARTVIIMWLKVIRVEQQLLVDHYLHDTWANVCPQLIAKGLIPAGAYAQRKYDYLASHWIPPKLDWVDPLKEVQGKKDEITIYSETPQSVCATKGADFEENVEATALALKRIKELEKEHDIKMPSLFEGGGSGMTEEDGESNKLNKSSTPNEKGKVLKIKK